MKAEFVTHVGYRVLFNVRQVNGKPIMFGAMATTFRNGHSHRDCR
ncbi:hypothetical protein ACLB1E_05800 [Escherichia coli]